jgi:ribose transport system substrate-binding protein
VAALIVDPVDQRVAAAVAEADAARVPVVTVSRTLRGVAVTSHIASDHVDGGRSAAAYLAGALGRAGSVVELTGDGSDADRERGNGFRQSMARYSAIRVVRVRGGGDRQTARRAMSAVLATRRIDGVFAHNDLMVLGAADAVRAARRQRPVLVGFDGVPDVVAAIDRGEVTATVAQQPGEMGWLAVETCASHLGGRPTSGHVVIDLALVTR